MLDGYGLFRAASAGWNWSPVPEGTPRVTCDAEGSGWRVRFAVPLSALQVDRSGVVRVGAVSGTPGTSPYAVWRTDALYSADADAGPEWLVHERGDARLQQARCGVHGDQMKIDLVYSEQPQWRTPWDLYLLIWTDTDDTWGYQGADYLLQNTKLPVNPQDPLEICWMEIAPKLVLPGQIMILSVCVTNHGEHALHSVNITLDMPSQGALVGHAGARSVSLRPGEAVRLTYQVRWRQCGQWALRLEVRSGDLQLRRTRWVSVVSKRVSRHEYQSAAGGWFPFPPRPTLQRHNVIALSPLRIRDSARNRANLFGITAHLPRSADSEHPFVEAHAADGDPHTCWASRWWRTPVPETPEWLQIDLGTVRELGEVRFLPAFRNSGMPAGLRLSVSLNGRQWRPAFDAPRYDAQHAADGDALRLDDRTWQRFRFGPQKARFIRLEATRLTAQGTSFFCAPYEPYQFRVAEVDVRTVEGIPLERHAWTVSASSRHNAWYNSAEANTRLWPRLFQTGVKLNRIGQWGDKVDWATVEQQKGVLQIDPQVDAAITEMVTRGVEPVLTLAYGNNLYQQAPDHPDFGPTWRRGHPFLQCAPTTPEAVRAFARYCAFMASHFRGRIRYVEIWNEENGWFFEAWAHNNTVAMVRAYGRALKAAAQAIKQVNPSAQVLFGGMAGSSLDFVRLALEEGAAPYIDILAFHPYGHPTPEAAPDNLLTQTGATMEWRPRPPQITNYITEIQAYRELFRSYGREVSVWANEMNWMAPGQPPMTQHGDASELYQAKYLARFFALNSWLGCGAIWWSLYNANGVQEWAVLRSSDGSPRASWYAAGYVATALDDARDAPDVSWLVQGDAPDDLMTCAWRSGRAVILGLWRTSVPSDACNPIAVTLNIAVTARRVTLMDMLYGVTQPAVAELHADHLYVRDLLVGDWPLLVRLE